MLKSFVHHPTSVFDEVSRLQREMEQLFGGAAGPASIRATGRGSFPAVNVGRTDDALEVFVFVPGVRLESLEVAFHQGLLMISGQRDPEVVEGAEGLDVYLQERFHGPFRRSISLSEDVDPDAIEAEYRDGVLRIRAPKRQSVRPQKVVVK
jgi:HSP20 family protein